MQRAPTLSPLRVCGRAFKLLEAGRARAHERSPDPPPPIRTDALQATVVKLPDYLSVPGHWRAITLNRPQHTDDTIVQCGTTLRFVTPWNHSVFGGMWKCKQSADTGVK